MSLPVIAHILTSVVSIHSRSSDVEHRKMELVALEKQIDQETSLMDAQANLARDLISSLIDRRVDAVMIGFREVLTMYKDQADHFMAQQEKLEDAKIKITAPLECANYDKRITEIDIQLDKIRMEARLLYDQMTSVLMMIGGAMPSLGQDVQQSLRLRR